MLLISNVPLQNVANNQSIYIVEKGVLGHLVAIIQLLLLTSVLILNNHCTMNVDLVSPVSHFIVMLEMFK